MSLRTRPEKLGSVVATVLAERGYLSVCREYDVMRSWRGIVGDRVAAATECTNVENGTLYVRVTSAAWRQEISYLKQEILASIRQKTSCTTIRDIVFH
jgi:predicted nucleic acid-binding Zn ribbon protein